ncbi:3-hydroxyacyl-CoA dehydrogenase NAD-binding domain-containing protein [Planktotalea sp.]|uniref:3-hydroxyacyl-CoA dehydrogenase NAD-binding domain-containing protein n=1 Tax=Planktotalea sp. TaxID=2029877 RepID=UPI003D6AEC8B
MADAIQYKLMGEIAILTANNPPVNALSHAVRQGLIDGIERAENEAKAVVIVGGGRTFFAGADITEFGKPFVEPGLPSVCARIERSPLPVVASLHGTALGGGLEVALGTHYRIAIPSAKVGLPEVLLGLLPGAGGTQRLPRVIGAENAIDIITSGRQVGASEALKLGIIDEIADGDVEEIGVAYAERLLKAGKGPRPVADLPCPTAIDFDAAYDLALKKGRGQIAPATAIRAIEVACNTNFDEGIEQERQMFMTLLASPQSKGMIHAFFNERAVSKLPELKGVEPRALNALGVIGGGTMGAGITVAALLAGLDVTMVERDAAAAEAGAGRVAGILQGSVKRGKLSQDKYDAIMAGGFRAVDNYDALADVDLVIEAAFEEMGVKKAIFAELDRVCKQGAVLASNTSYLDVNEIAASTSRPSDVIGLHFFSPAHVMKLLEVVVADQTAPDVVATGFALGKALRKISVRSGVCDGFIGNRILKTYRTCADHMVLDGASPYEIDKAMTAFGFAMGPFEVGDLAGLDIGWATRKRLAPTRDPHERVSTYPDKMCEAGNFGQKTGKGYYIYEKGKRGGTPDPEVTKLIEAERAELGITARDFSHEEIQRRYMCAMINEAAKVVDEGIARRPLDVDMVLLFGYGFPRHWGGPMKWADMQGLDSILADINRYAEEDDFFWQPSDLLTRLVAAGKSFDDLNKGDTV